MRKKTMITKTNKIPAVRRGRSPNDSRLCIGKD